MKIESQFNLHNLVQRKFDTKQKNVIIGLEVMEIFSQTCYGGTQIFYLCKVIECHKEFEKSYKEEGEFKWVVGHRMGIDIHDMGWKKYREDELIEASQEFIDIVLGNDK